MRSATSGVCARSATAAGSDRDRWNVRSSRWRGLGAEDTVAALNKYRKCLAGERKKGSLAHCRYTFSQFPFLEIDPDEFIVLRPAWALDRFCGRLYWETFADLGYEKLAIRALTSPTVRAAADCPRVICAG